MGNACDICQQEELAGHKRNFHSASINLKCPSGGDSITLVRGDDQLFKCPVCNMATDNYQKMYNHWHRMNEEHRVRVERYIESRNLLVSESSTRETFQPPEALDIQDIDAKMEASASKSQTSPGPASEIQQVTDADMAALEAMSPYMPSPIQSPDTNGCSEAGMVIGPININPPATPPRFTAQEKAKGRLRQMEDISPLRLTAATPNDPSIEDHVSILPIPYGSPDIITSPYLNNINCVVYAPLHILICIICRIGVQPNSLQRHRRGLAHSDTTSLPKVQINTLIAEYNLLPGDVIINLPDPFLVVPGIPYTSGLRCTFPNCHHGRRGGRKKMGEHIVVSHQSSIRDWEPVSSLIQVLFDSNTTNYTVILPGPAAAPPVNPPDMDQVLFSEYLSLISQIEAPPVSRDSAHLTPFLAAYNWDTVIQGLRPDQIKAWISLPTTEEVELARLVNAVRVQYLAVADEISRPGDAWTTVLRYINTSKGDVNAHPFKVPMKHNTTMRYVSAISCLLTFVLRFKLGKVRLGDHAPNLRISPPVSEASQRLLDSLSSPSSPTALSDAIHHLLMSLLQEPRIIPFNTSMSLCALFIVFRNVNESGQIKNPEDIRGTLTELKWPFRASAFREISIQLAALGDSEANERVEDSIIQVVESVQRYLKEDGFTLFSYILELSRFVSHLAAKSVLMPRLMWMDQVGEELMLDGRPLSMAAFRNMFKRLLENTTTLLHQVVLLGLQLPDLNHHIIHDVLSETTPGYSFLTDQRNTFHLHRQFLISAMLDASKTGTRFSYQIHSNPSGIVWNMSGVQEWLKAVETCLGNLFALMHYGSGQPGRGTELSILCWVNTVLHPRNLYWFGGHLNVITLYNKTQTNTGSQRLISRSLEPHVGQLFILWGSLVAPALVCLATSIRAPSKAEAIRFHTLVFTSLDREWDSEDLSSILSSISGEPVAGGGLGYPLGLAATRHVLIGIMKRHLHELVDRYKLTDELFNEQSGHGEEVAKRYGLDFASIQNFPEERLRIFLCLSQVTHKLITGHSSLDLPGSQGLSSHPIPSTKLTHSVAPRWTPEDVSSMAREIAALMVPTIAVTLAPRIQTNIAEGFAAIVPINATANAVSYGPSVRMEAGMEVIDAGAVSVDPARYAELRTIMGSQASFRSKEQAAAVELTAQRRHNLLLILGTGGGKSLVFMAAAANAEEIQQGLMTVVVIPLRALLQDMSRRLDEKNIKYIQWTAGTSEVPHNTRCILVSADAAASPSFLTFLRKIFLAKQLARIVLDEVQAILTSEHYRPLLGCLGQLRELAVQLLLLSATMPVTATAQLLQKLQILPATTKLIRAPTTRPNIVYSRFKIDSQDANRLTFTDGDGRSQNIAIFISNYSKNLRVGGRILVYCLTRNDAELLAGRLGCGFYHAKLEEARQKLVYNQWTSGQGSGILTTTSCLGAGMDYPSVRMVVHWKSPRNLLDKEQESGRAGRDGQEAHSVVFWDPSDKGWKSALGQSVLGVEEQKQWACMDQCLRIIPGAFMDGRGDTCFQLGTVKLCDWCRAGVPKQVIGANSTQRMKDIRVALTELQQEAPVVQDTLKRKRASSPVVQDTPKRKRASSPVAGPSTAMQISASRAVSESNRNVVEEALALRDLAHVKALLLTIKNTIGTVDKCSSCWFMGIAHDHGLDACPKEFAALRRSLKKFDLPDHHCFTCGLPQIYGLHSNVTKANPCPNSDFIRAVAVTVWHRSTDRDAFLKHMKAPISAFDDYGLWLVAKGEGKWINMAHLLLWVWDQRAAAGVSTKEPAQSPSDGSHTVHQWCSKRGLQEVDEAVLIKLGFVVGDDLNCLSETDWSAAGALALQRVRILQAFQKLGAT